MMRVEWMNGVAQADPALLPHSAPQQLQAEGEEPRQARVGINPAEPGEASAEGKPLGAREREGSEEDLGRMVRELNQELASQNRVALIKMDESINKRYISVIEKESRKVVQEFPPEEIRGYIRTIRDLTSRAEEHRKGQDPGLLDLEA